MVVYARDEQIGAHRQRWALHPTDRCKESALCAASPASGFTFLLYTPPKLVQPHKPRQRSGARPILAPDPPLVTELVQEIEQRVAIELARVGLVTVGNAGDLDMADIAQPAAQLDRQIALDDLGVIEIHLHFHVPHTDFLADGVRFSLRRQQISGHVARIERLDGQRDAVLLRLSRCEAQIAYERRPMPRALSLIRARRKHARHYM